MLWWFWSFLTCFAWSHFESSVGSLTWFRGSTSAKCDILNITCHYVLQQEASSPAAVRLRRSKQGPLLEELRDMKVWDRSALKKLYSVRIIHRSLGLARQQIFASTRILIHGGRNTNCYVTPARLRIFYRSYNKVLRCSPKSQKRELSMIQDTWDSGLTPSPRNNGIWTRAAKSL